MKKYIILIVLMLTIGWDLLGQEGMDSRFSISVSGGAAAPVGPFGNKDIANAIIYVDHGGTSPRLAGIDKSKSGFAELGYFVGLEMKYMLNQSFGLRLRTGYTHNSVYTEGVSQFFTASAENREHEFEHDDYRVFHIAPGLGYEKKIGAFNLGLGVYSGFARTNYPYYKNNLIFTGNPPIIWAHEGDRPALNALLVGGALNIDHKLTQQLSWGIECYLQHSNFNYSIRTRAIPGGCCAAEANDTLKTYLLNVGLKLQYHFTRKQ